MTQTFWEGDEERDPLGSPSAVEGSEVEPQMLGVINKLEKRPHLMRSAENFQTNVQSAAYKLLNHIRKRPPHYSLKGASFIYICLCKGVCVLSFSLLGLVCVFT